MAITASLQAPSNAPSDKVHVFHGDPTAKVMVICSPPGDRAWQARTPLDRASLQTFAEHAGAFGFGKGDFCFVGLCPPIPEQDMTSAKRKWDRVEPHVATLHKFILNTDPDIILTLGDLASRAVLGRAVAITKARGQVVVREFKDEAGAVLRSHKIMPMLSPGFIRKVPEHVPTFRSDFVTLRKLKDQNWSVEALTETTTDYRWSADLSDWMDKRPSVLAADTETTGLRHWAEGQFPFMVQFSDAPGTARCIPIHESYWEKVFPREPFSVMEEAKRQVASLIEDPAVRMMGHNLKFDHLMLTKAGMTPRGWLNDTQIMAFQVDENMMRLSLDECIRVYVPEMAGYADQFNTSIDKSRMIEVPPEQMLPYAGGDPDAVMRLARVLRDRMKFEHGQSACYRKIQMPALMMFAQVTEKYGVRIDAEHLETFGEEVREWVKAEYRWLVRQVPGKIRRSNIAAGKDLSFSRPDFTREVLFSPDGLGLIPKVFTKSTASLSPEDQIASTSSKDHLPYFVTDPKHGDFVNRLIEFLKAKKMASTYIGKREEGTGFWQYLAPDGSIYPSFSLTATNTGRTASRDPNGQNFPKRGRWAKSYLNIFLARPGYTLAASDLSQVELRLAAWASNDPVMLQTYRDGGDIHATTAAIAMGIPFSTFSAWKNNDTLLIDVANDINGSGSILSAMNPGSRRTFTLNDLYKLQRFRAKAVNFGFIYGAYAPTFQTYAKTNYGVDYTLREAELIRERYFENFASLPKWHESERAAAHKHSRVLGLHGSVRHLPSIKSDDKKTVRGIERQAINAPIQRLGSDLCLIGAVRFQSQVSPDIARVVLTIHDQVVLEVKEGREEEMVKALCWVMQTPPLEKWFGVTSPIPFGSDAEIGKSLGAMEEREDLTAEKPEWWNDDEDEVIRNFTLGTPIYSTL